MKIAEIVSPTLPAPVSTDLTWEQSWRFFALGCLRATIVTLLPVVRVIWKQLGRQHFVHWPDVGWLALSCAGPAALLYWNNHKYLLKLPPFLDIPPEFQEVHVEAMITQTTAEGTQVTKIDKTTTEPISPEPAPKP